MPLIRIDDLGHGVRLALWHMTESVEELPIPRAENLSYIHAEVRMKEKLTEYSLLHALTLRDDIKIEHNAMGQPYIEDYSISMSHTRGWAAMILASEDFKVGVDIEYYSNRVNKVADRFIRKDEQNDDLSHRLINWSAKETVYKMFSEEDLQYFEMRLHAFHASSSGCVDVDDLKIEKTVPVKYILNDDYVFTWSFLSKDFMVCSNK